MSKVSLRAVLVGAGLTAFALAAGCEVYDEPEPAGPIVYDSYYWNGYYDGPYWVYRDPEGHLYREAREEHARHMDAGYRGGHMDVHHEGPARGPMGGPHGGAVHGGAVHGGPAGHGGGEAGHGGEGGHR